MADHWSPSNLFQGSGLVRFHMVMPGSKEVALAPSDSKIYIPRSPIYRLAMSFDVCIYVYMYVLLL